MSLSQMCHLTKLIKFNFDFLNSEICKFREKLKFYLQ